jgi:A/G-specific adenine glycosylase
VRAWGRLGYPRRALRLHAAATACVQLHRRQVPEDLPSLRTLPGVGEYTAAAVAAFAFGRRVPVLDTNVRRVLARLLDGRAFERPGSPTRAEREHAWCLLPDDEPRAARTSAALMELGALVCTARRPGCSTCPVSSECAWWLAGRPAWDGPPRRGQTYAGTDRQCRGRLLTVLRETTGPVTHQELEQVWDDGGQRERALDGLVADGLVEPLPGSRYCLPGHGRA